MAHILVTGANGFIGSHLVRRLLELKEKESWDEDILCMVRHTSDLSSLKGLNVKLVIGDLRDPGSLVQAVKGATYIYHLGAEVYTINRKRFLDSITTGTENLLKAALTHAKTSLKRFLFVSSQAAAGPSPTNQPINEEHKPGPPVSWYAEAKLKAEEIARQYVKDLPITIVRPSAVYGHRDLGSLSIFQVAGLGIRAKTGLKKRYTGMVYAPDLVEGMIAAAQSPNTIGETYFLTNPKNYSVAEVSKIIGKAVGKPFGITIPIPIFFFRIAAIFSELLYIFLRRKPVPSRDKVRDLTQVNWLCTAEKAKKDFGWEAKTSLLEGAKATNDFIRADEKRLKTMPDETTGILRLKYFLLSLTLGVIIELLAWIGKVYLFTPWWLVFVVLLILWGLIFGWFAMITRRCVILVQYIPGFILLFGGELLNNYYLDAWTFENGPLGNMNPVVRALVLGILAGFLIPIINEIMKQLYKWKLRLG
ncbi:MAG: NAD-dependent epimerase/dehydratase family protein [Candidatus Aminicenantes bacterium]|nr:MAG: NAD-dependent epimerase/dehydratase family protein [Candidatus Aminicenantes bacterium]